MDVLFLLYVGFCLYDAYAKQKTNHEAIKAGKPVAFANGDLFLSWSLGLLFRSLLEGAKAGWRRAGEAMAPRRTEKRRRLAAGERLSWWDRLWPSRPDEAPTLETDGGGTDEDVVRAVPSVRPPVQTDEPAREGVDDGGPVEADEPVNEAPVLDTSEADEDDRGPWTDDPWKGMPRRTDGDPLTPVDRADVTIIGSLIRDGRCIRTVGQPTSPDGPYQHCGEPVAPDSNYCAAHDPAPGFDSESGEPVRRGGESAEDGPGAAGTSTSQTPTDSPVASVTPLFKSAGDQRGGTTPADSTPGPEWAPTHTGGIPTVNAEITNLDATDAFAQKLKSYARQVLDSIEQAEAVLDGEGLTDPAVRGQLAAIREQFALVESAAGQMSTALASHKGVQEAVSSTGGAATRTGFYQPV